MTYEECQRELDLQLDRLNLIDDVLTRPVNMLIRVYSDWRKGPKHGADKRKTTVPAYVTSRRKADQPALLTHAAACSTLQRLAKGRRRYTMLSKESKKFLDNLGRDVAGIFLPKLQPGKAQEFISEFDDHVFGALNPLAAAEIFRVLIKAGEQDAHSGAGFLMLFSMLWSLHREFPNGNPGARLDPWLPTASITAKCLLLMRNLYDIILRRAELYDRLKSVLEGMEDRAAGTCEHELWTFTAGLEQISSTMHALSAVAINGDEFEEAAQTISGKAAEISRGRPCTETWTAGTRIIRQVLLNLAATNTTVLREAKKVQNTVIDHIVKLAEERRHDELKEICNQLHPDSIRPDQMADYWKDIETAAKTASTDCRKAIGALQRGIEACKPLKSKKDPSCADFEKVLTNLSKANRKVAQQLCDTVMPDVDWLRTVIAQQVAFASAGNVTHFDPAELLSAVSVVQRWRKDFTEMEVRDALRKALEGQRRDGSWSTSQPIYRVKRVIGVWPSTPDVGWLLSSAAAGSPEITDGDEALFRFVEWLQKNRIDLPGDENKSGWASGTREEDVIDLWSTCVAINALIDIRELVEHRLWQLCRKRFVVRREENLKGLFDIAPVDLGRLHENRLHHRLARMARQTSSGSGKAGPPKEYAFVLHGPPGSSKTAIAEAIGREMWGEKKTHFIRITPADFTRGGEEGLDREARFIFDLLSHVRGVTIFFDEIDDLLRRRSAKLDVSFIKLIVPAMLNRLQDLHDVADSQEICFLMATNFIENIEPALTRPGRIDAAIPVPYPDAWSRESILESHFKGMRLRKKVKDHVVNQTQGWPWSTFNQLCRRLSERKSASLDAANTLLAELAEFERADVYYAQSERWEQPSQPLRMEFISYAMALSKDKNECKKKISELVPWQPDLLATFDAEWDIRDRQTS